MRNRQAERPAKREETKEQSQRDERITGEKRIKRDYEENAGVEIAFFWGGFYPGG